VSTKVRLTVRCPAVCIILAGAILNAVTASAQLLPQTPIVYTPTTTTESLLSRYSQVHTKPNAYWQLTDEEWKTYQALKEMSPWSVWENHATPLAILSYYATSIEEKRRYARIEAELDVWRQFSVTEFQLLYDKERKIVQERYVEYMEKRMPTLATLRPYDKLRLFVNAGDCDTHCRSLVSRVLKTQAKIDVFVIGANSDEVIFKWAESASIPVERVKTKEVTLNHDNGLFKIVSTSGVMTTPKLPALFIQTAGGGNQVVAI
jgi:integrating conjugative element protein (TIGR03759 family)